MTLPSDSFVTLKGYGRYEIEIKQSRFIGQAIRIGSQKEAEDFVDSVRREYPDARHSCYAWILDGEVHMQKYSDDGEPSGTAGMPILSILTKGGITNAAIVVTRYFGGILLGKGGLVRAYTDAAAGAVEKASVVRSDKGIVFGIDMSYEMSEKILYAVRTNNWEIENIDYSDKVTADILIREEEESAFGDLMTDRSSGKIVPYKKGTREILTPLA